MLSAGSAAAAEPLPPAPPTTHFYFKPGGLKGAAVLVVYVSSEFYDLYIWEKEAMLAPVFEETRSKNLALATIALRDAKSGKTVGTYSPKDGLVML